MPRPSKQAPLEGTKMPSPQVQNWLEEGSQLRDDLLAQMEKLEAQRHELDQMLNERRSELSLLARILDRADNEPAPAAPEAAGG